MTKNNKKTVVLVNPGLTKEEKCGESSKYVSHILPPLGLAYLAAVLRKKYNVAIIDAEGTHLDNEEVAKKVIELDPDYVGITATIISIFRAADIISLLKKEKPDVKIILGGPHVTAVPKETFKRFPQFEIAVLGEAETTIAELIDTLERRSDLEKVRGIIFRRGLDIIITERREYINDLDTLPLPAYDLLPEVAKTYRPSELTYHQLPSTSVITSRGCPFQCTFCDRSVFGNKWRYNSPQYILKMVKYLHDNFGIIDFYFTDDHFTVNKRRLREFCTLLQNEKSLRGITWSTIGRVDSVDPETLRVMADAGCKQIAYGLESGCQEILDFIKKGTTVEQAKKAVKWTKEAGIEAKGLFMVGAPIETKETLERTMKFIEEIKLDYISMSAFTPIPGAEIYKDAHRLGAEYFDDDWKKMNLWDVIFVPKGLTKEYLKQFVMRASVKDMRHKKNEKDSKRHQILVGSKKVGEGCPCFIIAEAGVNHNGNIAIAKKLIDAAVRAGADAVKFQTFKAEDLVTKEAVMANYQVNNLGKKESQLDMLKKLELNYDHFRELKEYCDKKGIIFLSTPHTEEAARFLDNLVPAFKIGSGDLTNLPFLEKIAKKGKPIILSTGMGTSKEVKEAVDIIKKYNKKLILLHCTTNYPCLKKDVNLKAMKTMEKECNCLIGYSDHTLGTDVPVAARYLGAAVVEKHFTLDKNMEGPDHKASLSPNELKQMVKSIKEKKLIPTPNEIFGSSVKKPTKEELKISKIVRKSIISARDIPPDTKITEDIIIIKRPGIGIQPKDYEYVIGKIAAKQIKKDSLIRWSDLK